MKPKYPKKSALLAVQPLLRKWEVHTVCESARCPNVGECFRQRAVTFMIMGDTCTRNCAFCAVNTGQPPALDSGEPERVAQAAAEIGVGYLVVTSVTRDDLPDGGAAHFAATVAAARRFLPDTKVEVLVSDFGGDPQAIATVAAAGPDVLAHNVETIPRLYPDVRAQAVYARSLELLRSVREGFPKQVTKSGLMVGLGESPEEVVAVMADLRAAGVDLLTIGQYLRPTAEHYPVTEYVSLEQFADYRRQGLEMGFGEVVSGPLVRSSYHADQGLACVTAGERRE
jgi:lipoic acid synthetase